MKGKGKSGKKEGREGKERIINVRKGKKRQEEK